MLILEGLWDLKMRIDLLGIPAKLDMCYLQLCAYSAVGLSMCPTSTNGEDTGNLWVILWILL